MGGNAYSKETDTDAPPAPVFTRYRRTQIAEMRPYVVGELLSSKVSISQPDQLAGSPKEGDMIARNPVNHEDQWLVAETYFKANFEPIPPEPREG